MSKKLTEVLSAIDELTAKVRVVQSDNANLRGQFNRKLLGIKKEEAAEEETKKEPSVFLGPNGTPLS